MVLNIPPLLKDVSTEIRHGVIAACIIPRRGHRINFFGLLEKLFLLEVEENVDTTDREG